MFSSRNIHLAILGIILGASVGYVVAFYNAQKALVPPPLSPEEAQGEVPAGHPDVNNQQMLEAMRKEVDTDSSNPEILKRFITESGKILPRRLTGMPAHLHRRITRAIKRSRSVLLMK